MAVNQSAGVGPVTGRGKEKGKVVTDEPCLIGCSIDVIHDLGGRKFFWSNPKSFGRVVIEKVFCCSTVDEGSFGSRPMFRTKIEFHIETVCLAIVHGR